MQAEALAVIGHVEDPQSLAQVKAAHDAYLWSDPSTVPQADLRRVLGV